MGGGCLGEEPPRCVCHGQHLPEPRPGTKHSSAQPLEMPGSLNQGLGPGDIWGLAGSFHLHVVVTVVTSQAAQG